MRTSRLEGTRARTDAVKDSPSVSVFVFKCVRMRAYGADSTGLFRGLLRLIRMRNCADRNETENYELLREAYDSAFQQLANESEQARTLGESGNEQEVAASRTRLDAATAVYRQRRDALAEPLLHPCD